MSYKFIFDTNVLKPEIVQKLEKENLRKECHSGRFAFYFTPVLLKERLDFLLKGAIPETTKVPIRFLLSIRWQELFNDLNGPEGIYALELEGKLPSEYLFTSYSEVRTNLELVSQGGVLPNEAREDEQRNKDRWLGQKQKNCIAFKKMRAQVNSHLRDNPSLTREGSKFSDFRDANFKKTAIDKINKSINSQISKEILIEYWEKYKERCQYFNKFIEGWLFMAWYAMEQEPKIDPNAYEDIEHLVYLNSVDGIVSNEKGFMKKACQELFPDKDFLSADEFIDKFLK